MLGWTRVSELKVLLAAAVLGVLVSCAAPAPTATPTRPPAAAPTPTKAPGVTATPTKAAIRFEGGKLQPLPDGFPKQSIKVFAGSVGGGTDVFHRALAKATQPFSPVPLVIENETGIATPLRYVELATAEPGGSEGYVLSNSTFSSTARGFTVAPPAKAKLTDIGSLIYAATAQYAMFVRGDSPWKTVADFVKYAKDNPGRALIGGTDPGGLSHMNAEAFAKAAGFQYTYLPHDGSADARNSLIGGGVDAVAITLGAQRPFVEAGQLMPIGILSSQRSPVFPQVPTFTEQGYKVGFDQFYASFALATVPKERVEWLQELYRRGMDTQEFKDYLAASGQESQAHRVKEFDQEFKASIPMIEDTIKALGLHYEQQPR
ncbi:MAG: tripartite tricarboxylate transporter substrate binding protein [Chloroflexi bacterium]|nr:tripartite tricarboxylate transporter substrate binding protein [Chloroflexota bacterium]